MVNIDDIHDFLDSKGINIEKVVSVKQPEKHRRSRLWEYIGACCVSLVLGMSFFLPLFADKSGFDILSESLSKGSSDVEGLVAVADEPEPVPVPFLYEHFVPPSNSFGMGETTFKTVNWSYFKQLFTEHCDWLLEYKRYESSDWTDGNQYLTIERSWNDSLGGWKFNLVLDAPVDVYSVRFTFACDLPVLNFVERDGWQVNLNYTVPGTDEVYNCFFNWSDMASIPGIVFSKGVQGDLFWFRFRRDNVPAGHYEFDPTFGQLLSGSTWNIVSNGNPNMVGAYSTPSSSGTADNITIIVSDADPTQSYQCALYAYVDYGTNWAGALIATTEIIEISSTGTYSFEFSEPKPSIVASTNYYLAVTTTTENPGINTIQRNAVANIGFKKDVDDGVGELELFDDPLTGEVAPFLNRVPYIYCSYTASGGSPWSNVPPVAGGEHPTNSSTGITLSPACGVTITDSNSNHTMNVTFATNVSGDWINQQTNTSVANNSAVNWTYLQANTELTHYFWRVYVHDGFSNQSFTYSFTTAANETPEQRVWNQFFDGYMTGGNSSRYNELFTGWLSGGNISSYHDLFSGYVSGGNNSVDWNDLFSGWLSGGDMPLFQDLFTGWVSGGNISNWYESFDGWVSGGNVSQDWDELFSGWLSGGDISVFQDVSTGWLSGGNNSIWYDMFSGYVSGGNTSSGIVWNQFFDGYMTGGNSSRYNELFTGWLSGGNTSYVKTWQILDSGWLSGGNSSARNWNAPVFDGWVSGGNHTGNFTATTVIVSGGDDMAMQTVFLFVGIVLGMLLPIDIIRRKRKKGDEDIYDDK